MKFEELHDLRIILKGGGSIITKNVRDWKFGEDGYNVKWPKKSQQNIAWIDPKEIAGVEIIKRKLRLCRGNYESE